LQSAGLNLDNRPKSTIFDKLFPNLKFSNHESHSPSVGTSHRQPRKSTGSTTSRTPHTPGWSGTRVF